MQARNETKNQTRQGKANPHQLEATQKSYQEKVTHLYPCPNLIDIYQQYIEYKSAQDKEGTRLERLETILPKLEESGVTDIDNALELRDYLIGNYSESMSKRVLKQVKSAYAWSIKEGIIKGSVQCYRDLIKDLKHNFEKSPQPMPFSEWEKEAILEAFASHRVPHGGKSLNRFYPFVKFLFMTGCRPSEAIGLTWDDIDFRTNKITFDGGIQYKGGKFITTKGKGSKSNKKRQFPMNAELSNFLKSLSKHPISNLVFPNTKGTPMIYKNFANRGWKTIIQDLRIKKDATPYSCRDTFISEQISKGVSPMIVAKWCDTSVGVIEKYYFGNISNIIPL